jgi:hypothetical protein
MSGSQGRRGTRHKQSPRTAWRETTVHIHPENDMSRQHFDLIAIGGGSGGLAVAGMAASLAHAVDNAADFGIPARRGRTD